MNKTVVKKEQTLDKYFGSKEYSDDIKKLIDKLGNKTTFDGVTKDGYTRFVTLSGETVSIPVSTK